MKIAVSLAMFLVLPFSAQANFGFLRSVEDMPPLFSPRIVGGEDAEPGEFPFIVTVGYKGRTPFCGGSLIQERWVLTAGHCLRGDRPEDVEIRIGAHRLNDTTGVEIHAVERIIVHPLFDTPRGNLDYDFALVELRTASAYRSIGLNSLPTEIPEDGEPQIEVVTAGWGNTREGGSRPRVLQKVTVPLVSEKRCDQAYPGDITDRMICAGLDQGGKDSCQGDSGGPLFLSHGASDFTLVGVVSWGLGCARPKKFGVYSKVSSVFDWIQSESLTSR
jgi:trypsin